MSGSLFLGGDELFGAITGQAFVSGDLQTSIRCAGHVSGVATLTGDLTAFLTLPDYRASVVAKQTHIYVITRRPLDDENWFNRINF